MKVYQRKVPLGISNALMCNQYLYKIYKSLYNEYRYGHDFTIPLKLRILGHTTQDYTKDAIGVDPGIIFVYRNEPGDLICIIDYYRKRYV